MKKLSLILICLFFSLSAYGHTTKITYNGSGNYELTERTDLRRYDNGKYTGLVSREVASFIIPVSNDNGYLYDGSFYIDEKTLRNMRKTGISVNDEIPSVFKIDDKGQLTMIEDNGFPSFRSFPSFPDTPITVGSSWEAKAVRAVDPLNKGIVTRLPIYVKYVYKSDSVFNEEEVYVISAQWATRYGVGTGSYYIDWAGDDSLEKATGSHNATLYVSKKSGNTLLIKDMVDETFFYDDGNQVRFKGTISLFTKYPPAIDRTKIIPVLKRIANLTDEEADKLLDAENIIHSEIKNPTYVTKNDNNNISTDGTQWEAIDGSILTFENNKEPKHNDRFYIDDELNNSSKTSFDTDSIKHNIRERLEDNTNTSNNYELDIKVENTTAGLRLTIHNLQFLPDSSELVPGQTEKLDEIADLLKTLPNRRFLIEGHTASTGYEKGEMKLSLERANAIKDKFISKGLQDAQFICRGSGGKKPLADNSTKEGKAINRRVEITILE